MASWFSRKPPTQLGPPWAVPEASLFDDDEDPAARLLRRRVRWEVIDESRNARITGQEVFLSLAVLRLSSDSGIGARIPLTSIHREEYMQPIFGANNKRTPTNRCQWDGATNTKWESAKAPLTLRHARTSSKRPVEPNRKACLLKP